MHLASKSTYYNPKREAFLGVALTTLDVALIQDKRWSKLLSQESGIRGGFILRGRAAVNNFYSSQHLTFEKPEWPNGIAFQRLIFLLQLEIWNCKGLEGYPFLYLTCISGDIHHSNGKEQQGKIGLKGVGFL